MNSERTIAYFSMEVALNPAMPTYSGGLGVLAGDTIRSAADLKLPLLAVTLLHRKGYFFQKLDESGWQTEESSTWATDDFLEEVEGRVSVSIEGRTVSLRAWRYNVRGASGFDVPVYFLDTNLDENSEWDRTLTDHLYGGDEYYRLCQEIVLGMGGVKMLRRLGFGELTRFHMNEGHSSLLALELLDERIRENRSGDVGPEDLDAVRELCVFTTHTPVPAGQDKFPMEMVEKVLAHPILSEMKELFCCEGVLNMTHLALTLSHYVNGVAKKHGEVSRNMFSPYVIDAITNGVHPATWTSAPFQVLYDRYIPGWREDSFSLRYALSIPVEDVQNAHRKAKRTLLDYVNRETNAGMDVDVLTLGFARRAALYKRADLIFHDIERLKNISANVGEIQIVFAGKAHPRDVEGKELIQRIHKAADLLAPTVKIVYLSNYDMELGRLVASGVDVWLNTPVIPLEASGTSGMKAALNGVPSLSILDGWWIEGCIEGVTGWAIGIDGHSVVESKSTQNQWHEDASRLYEKLEEVVVPLFYSNGAGFTNIMLHAVALNGSFFNTHRMLQQYVLKAYF